MLPGNPLVVGYAPQLELLSRATLTITHAGLNTALESLSAGVPMVAIPVGNDQPGVSARLKAARVGRFYRSRNSRADRLRPLVKESAGGQDVSHACARLRSRDTANGRSFKSSEDCGGAPGREIACFPRSLDPRYLTQTRPNHHRGQNWDRSARQGSWSVAEACRNRRWGLIGVRALLVSMNDGLANSIRKHRFSPMRVYPHFRWFPLFNAFVFRNATRAERSPPDPGSLM